MTVRKKNSFQPGILYDTDGNVIDSVLVAGIRRLAVDAAITVSEIQIGAVELDDAEGSTRAMIREDGALLPALPGDSGALSIQGLDGAAGRTRHIAVNGLGQLVTAPGPITSGTTIVTGALTPVPAGPAVPLPVPPPGTLSMTVQNFAAGSVVVVREAGGPPGAGIFLPNFGSSPYGDSIAPLEAEHISGPAGLVTIQFQAP
jgi:hypothetical protein